jgi:hypothetical protein
MNEVFFRRLFFIPLIASVFLVGSAIAGDCVLTGRIHVQTFGGGSDVAVNDYTFRFRCWKGNDRWAIESQFLKNATELFTFDRTNIYRVLTITSPSDVTNSRVVLAAHHEQDSNNENFLVIPPGEHPLGNAGVNVVWLALCSEHYLQNKGRQIPLPICEIRHTVSAFSLRDTTRLLAPGGLPSEVELREAPELLAPSRSDPRFTIGALMRNAPDLVDGRLACRYRVVAHTNSASLTLPTEFELNQFTYHQNGSVEWHVHVSGAVDSISSADLPPVPFKEGVGYHVTDLRFRSETRMLDGLNYRWQKGQAPETSDEGLRAMFLKEEARRPLQQ